MINIELVVVGVNNCAPCEKLASFLDSEEVEYKYIDALSSRGFRLKHKVRSTPTILLFDNDYTDDYASIVINGFSEENKDQIYEILDLLD